MASSVEVFSRTLELLKIVHERTRGSIPLSTMTAALNATGNSEVERRVARFDRDAEWPTRPTGNSRHATIRSPTGHGSAAANADPASRLQIGEPVVGRVSGKLSNSPGAAAQRCGGSVRWHPGDGPGPGAARPPVSRDPCWRALGDRPHGPRGRALRAVHLDGSAAGRRELLKACRDPPPPRSAAKGARCPPWSTRRAWSRSRRSRAPALVAFAAFSEDQMLVDLRRYARNINGFALLTLTALSLPILLVARRALREVVQRSRLEIGMAAERQNARTDALTEAANRRAFEDALKRCHAELPGNGTAVRARLHRRRSLQAPERHARPCGR